MGIFSKFKTIYLSSLVLYIFLLCSFVANAKLNGTFTIDSSKSASLTNYKDVASAIYDLDSGKRYDGGTANGSGVSGPVIFKIADGVYYGQYHITAISGASSTNTIIFTSSSGDSSKAILTFPSTYNSSIPNYILFLEGVNWITFQKLTIQRTGKKKYGAVILYRDGASNNNFLNNRILGIKTDSFNYYQNLVSSPYYGGIDTNVTFQNNFMKWGIYGIDLTGYGSAYIHATGNSIIGNIIDSSYEMAIHVGSQDSLTISDNVIRAAQQPYTIDVEICNKYLLISGNKIIVTNKDDYGSYYGIYIEKCIGNSSRRQTIQNNYVAIQGSQLNSSSALYEDKCQYQNYYDNTLVAVGSYSFASQFLDLSDMDILNNIFASKDVNFPYRIGNPIKNITSDYNNFYTEDTSLIAWKFGAYKTLAAYQKATGNDMHSIAVNPYFYSTFDPHVWNPKLNEAAKFKAGPKDDIDKDIRDTVANPDIGADEFTPAVNDAGILSIDSFDYKMCPGLQNVHCSLVNYGSSNLTSVNINWEVNDTLQTTHKWIGTLKPGDSVKSLKIGNYVFAGKQTYTMKIYTSSPNGASDGDIRNDTFTGSRTITQLMGSYTIGSSGDYSTFAKAFYTLNSIGICGSVIFKVQDDTFNEQVTLKSIHGASAKNIVIFQSQSNDSSKVILTSPSLNNTNPITLTLDGAQWVTFQKITIQHTGSGQSSNVIVLENGASNNKFLNNRIIGTWNGKWSNFEDLISEYNRTSAPDSNNLFQNNLFRKGTLGIVFDTYNYTKLISGANRILGNIFDSCASGISMSGQRNFYFNNNIVFAASGTGVAINCLKRMEVLNNKIFASIGLGLTLNGCHGGGSYYTKQSIYNNFITGYGSSNYDAAFYNGGGDSQEIYNNNILAIGSSSTSALYNANPEKIDMRNNNFIANNGGTAYKYDDAFSTSANVNSDYNNFLSNNLYRFIEYNNIGYKHLSDFQKKYFKELHSDTLDPLYISDTDLHIKNRALKGKAVSAIAPIDEDIDGQVRVPFVSTIGADELEFAIDANLFGFDSLQQSICSSTRKITVNLRNCGTDTLTKVNIDWSINSSLQTRYYWTGSLLPNKSIQIFLGKYTFDSTKSYSIMAWVSNPNGVKDSASYYDSTNFSVKVTTVPNGLAGSSQSICQGSKTTIGSTYISGYIYSWTSKPNGFSSSLANPSVSPTSNTLYYLYTKDSISGCGEFDSVKVTITPLPSTPSLSNNSPVCKGDSLKLTTSLNSGATYKWSGPNGFSSSLQSPSISQIKSIDSGYYKCSSILSGCASLPDSTHVKVYPGPSATINGANAVCDSSLNLYNSINNFYSYAWKVSGGSILYGAGKDTFSVNWGPSGTGSISLIVKDLKGCIDSNTIAIKIYSKPLAKVISDTSICKGSTVLIGSSPTNGNKYHWNSFPIGFSDTTSNPKVSPARSTRYYLTEIVSNAGCSRTDSTSITVHPIPVSHWKSQKTGKLKYILTADDSSLSASSYVWNFGDGNIGSGFRVSHIYTNDSTFKVQLEVTNTYGCFSAFDSTFNLITGITAGSELGLSLDVYPNPFNGKVTIEYALPISENIDIKIYSTDGKAIAEVVNQKQVAGIHQLLLESDKYIMKGGIYFIQIIANDKVFSKKLIKIEE